MSTLAAQRRLPPVVGVVLAVCLLTTALSAQVPQNVYYKFNEGSGTTTANTASPGIGSASPAISGTPNWVTPGQVGTSALNFTGSQFISAGTPLSLPSSQAWTFEFWFRPTVHSLMYIFADGDNVGTSFNNLRCSWANTSNSIQLAGANDGIGTALSINAGSILNTWHHFAFVYNPTAGTITGYMDGVQSASGPYTPNITGAGLIVARLDPASTYYLNGALDEFRFWTVARTQAEIQSTMNVELPLGPTLTVAATAGTAVSVFANDQGPGGTGRQAGTFTIESNNQPPGPTLTNIELTASGTGNDAAAFTDVRVFRDHPTLGTQGVFDPADTLACAGQTFPADNGVINFVVETSEQGFPPNELRRYFVVTRMAGTALPGQDFKFTVTDISVDASSFKTVPTGATMNGLVIGTPSFVFADVSATPAQEVFVTLSGVCNAFTISYPAGPDDKPASLTLNSQGTADEAADLTGVALYWDSDNSGDFVAANDTLIDTQVFTSNNGDVTFNLATLPSFQAGDTRRFFVIYTLNASASDLETLQCRVFSMGTASLGGTASGLPLAFSAGLVIRAAILFGSMTGPGAAVTVNSNAQEVLIADVLLDTLPGGVGSWDIPTLTFNAGGTGNHNNAYTRLALYEDTNANNAWDAGDTLAAPVLPGFTANVANFDLIQPNQAPSIDRRFFLVGNMSGRAATGDTFGARLTSLTVTQRPQGGQELGFPTAASTALIIDVAALSVSNAPEQPASATHAAGTAGELVGAAFRLNALNGGATVNGITFTTSGTGDWSSDVDSASGVQIYHDDGDGVFDAGTDSLLAQAGGAALVTATFTAPLNLAVGEIADLWVVIGLTATAGQGIAATPETFSLTIANTSDVSASAPVEFGMPAPNGITVGAIEFSVTNFDPVSGLAAGGQALIISGSGFMAPFTVTIGGTPCLGTAVIAGGTQVTGLTIPPGFGDTLPIVVQSGDLPPQTLTQTFTYTAPKDNAPPKSDDGGSCSGDAGARWSLPALFAGALLMGVSMMLRRRSA